MHHLTILLYRVDTDAPRALFRPPKCPHIKVLDSIRKPQNEPAFIFTPPLNVVWPPGLPPKSDPHVFKPALKFTPGRQSRVCQA